MVDALTSKGDEGRGRVR